MLTADEQKTVDENYTAVLAELPSKRTLEHGCELEVTPGRYLLLFFDECDCFVPQTYDTLEEVEAEVATTIRYDETWWIHHVYDLATGRKLEWDYRVTVTVQP
jgi:hypothetical protein